MPQMENRIICKYADFDIALYSSRPLYLIKNPMS